MEDLALKEEENTLLKHVNKLLKHSRQPPINNLSEFHIDFWFRIMHVLFIQCNNTLQLPFQEKVIQFDNIVRALNKKYPTKFTHIDSKLVLKQDEKHLNDFCHSLLLILKDKMLHKLAPDERRRVKEAIDELQDLCKSLGIAYPFHRFKDVKPFLWINILSSLFNIPDKTKLINASKSEPLKVTEYILFLLQDKILKRPLNYINPIELCQGQDFACTLFSELIVSLGKAIILRPFDNVRHFSFDDRDSSASILSDGNIDPSIDPSLISEINNNSVSIRSFVSRPSHFQQKKILSNLRANAANRSSHSLNESNHNSNQNNINEFIIPEELRPLPTDDSLIRKAKEKKINQLMNLD